MSLYVCGVGKAGFRMPTQWTRRAARFGISRSEILKTLRNLRPADRQRGRLPRRTGKPDKRRRVRRRKAERSNQVTRGVTRKPIPVQLTEEQRDKLEHLWFIYGNYGEKTTPGNHGFIQGLLEHGQDERPLRNRYTTPTDECAAAVDAILSSKVDS